MQITNKKNLPEGIVKAVENDYYDKGDAKFSVTGLLQPPQLRRLFALNIDNITIDASEEIWKLFGSAVHHILDRAQNKVDPNSHSEVQLGKIALELEGLRPDTLRTMEFETLTESLSHIYRLATSQPEKSEEGNIITEKRLYLTVGDVVISGAMDWYNVSNEKVEDYKVTTVYKVTKGDHSDWEAQQNIYGLLLTNAGYSVKELQINAILKDYSRKDATKAKADEHYPDCPVEKVSIPLWKPLDTLKFLIEKIEDQMSVEEITDAEDIFKVRPCTRDEKWQAEDKFALMKKGGKRASKVFDNFPEANAESIQKGADYFVETRKGYAIRCEEYCPVKDFCAQYRKENAPPEVKYNDMKTEALKQLEDSIPDTAPEEKKASGVVKEETKTIIKDELDTLLENTQEKVPEKVENKDKNDGDDNLNMEELINQL